jgi:hypothetical protein
MLPPYPWHRRMEHRVDYALAQVDHRLQGRAVLPGAAYVVMACEAALLKAQAEQVRLRKFRHATSVSVASPYGTPSRLCTGPGRLRPALSRLQGRAVLPGAAYVVMACEAALLKAQAEQVRLIEALKI